MHKPGQIHRTTKNADGYSILELVVVAGILSILAGISVPRIGNIITSSKIDEAKHTQYNSSGLPSEEEAE